MALKVIELFGGIGACTAALKRLGINYEVVDYVEIDKYAVKSYNAINGTNFETQDVTTWDKDIEADLIMYGFPCQDISLAGKQKGMFNEDGSHTRSGLFFEALRIIEKVEPKIAIAENVKNLTSKKFSAQFQIVLQSLEEAGYSNYWKVLNAKDYGIPQNRERVFIVSIRKDLDTGYEFPEPFPLELRLKDILDDEVDEKFYLSEKCTSGLIRYESSGEIKQVAQIYPNSGNPQAGRIYDPDGISPAMDTCSGGNRMPKVIVKEATTGVVVNE